jgi:hypothetical protein
MNREVCHFSYLRVKEWTVKCAISRICVLNTMDREVCHFSYLRVKQWTTKYVILRGPLLNRLTRKITNACNMNAFFSWFIYQNAINS